MNVYTEKYGVFVHQYKLDIYQSGEPLYLFKLFLNQKSILCINPAVCLVSSSFCKF